MLTTPAISFLIFTELIFILPAITADRLEQK
jgi:hypothetical protein